MIEQNKWKEQLEHIKQNPSQIDYLITWLTGKWEESPEAIKNTIEEAMALTKEQDNRSAYLRFFCLKQEYQIVWGNYDEVIEDCIGLHKEINTSKMDREETILDCDIFLAVAYTKKGWFEQALIYQAKCIEEIDTTTRRDIKLKAILCAIQIHIALEQYDKAKELLKEIESLEQVLLDTASFYINLAWARIYVYEGQLEEAMKYCKSVYEKAKKNEKQFILQLINVLYLRGQLNEARALHTQAEKDYNESIALCEKTGYKELLIQNFIALGRYKQTQEEGEEAKVLFLKALELSKAIGSSFLIMVCYKALSQLYEKMEDWANAFSTLKKYEAYRDDIYNKKVETWIERIEHKEIKIEVEKYKNLYDEVHLISQIGATLTKNIDLGNLFGLIYTQLNKLFEIDLIVLLSNIDNKEKYSLLDHRGETFDQEGNIKRHMEYLAHYCMEQHCDIVVNNGDFETYHIKEIESEKGEVKVESVMYTPLFINDKVIGAVGIGSYKTSRYNNTHLKALHSIAAYMAIAIKNAQLFTQIEFLATHDGLTHLLNRRAILSKAEELFKSNQKKRKKTVVMMLDIDYFKQINDKYGHQVGDEVLSKIGKILSDSVRDKDYVGRYGGEEFLVVLDDATDREVVEIAKKIKLGLEEAEFNLRKEGNLKVTLSGGFYVCNEYTLNFSDAVQFADHALYRAKWSGRNQILCYSLAAR